MCSGKRFYGGGGVKQGLGLGRSIEQGRDIPVGRTDPLQEEIEELEKLGSRPDHGEKSKQTPEANPTHR